MKVLLLILTLILCGCSTSQKWFRGNTHVHTELCGHADSHPDVVAEWYLDRDYNFLILSEHNRFIDPKTVNLPKDRRKDFILVPGQEVTGRRHIHSTAMNVDGLVAWKYDNNKVWKIIERHVHDTEKAGGHTILNHPNWQKAVKVEDMKNVKGLNLFELYNGHPDVLFEGGKGVDPAEIIWDQMLTSGKHIYGVSSDDAHHFKKLDPKKSNPGRGWIMVNSGGVLTPDALTEAVYTGNFYSSNGVVLSKCSKDHHTYEIAIDVEATEKELQKEFVVGRVVFKDKPEGYLIEFVSDGGKVLKSSTESSALFDIPEGVKYVRARAVLTRKEDGVLRQYFAWGQPVFAEHDH